jgi:hypothetical protein
MSISTAAIKPPDVRRWPVEGSRVKRVAGRLGEIPSVVVK